MLSPRNLLKVVKKGGDKYVEEYNNMLRIKVLMAESERFKRDQKKKKYEGWW